MNKNRYPFWALALLLAGVILALYSVSLGHNFFFDEENIILNNPTIRSFHQIPEIFKHGYFYFKGRAAPQWDEYYRPLTSLTFMLDYHFWKANPLGYNLTNLFLHIALCILYFRLLAVLLDHRIAAFLAALLYAVHTIHTEAVTYTASRGDILGIVLMLAAMLLYLRRRSMAALFCYFLALFSKETMILLPFYILALDIGFVKSRPKDLPKNTGPFFLVMIFFWLYRKFLCPIPFTPFDPDLRAVLLRMLGMGDGILQYVRALLAPEYFKPFSDVPELYGFGDPLLWTAVTVGSLLLAAWLLALRYRGLAFIAMTVFLVGLAPHFQILRVYPKWAEHYICISSLGLFLLLGMMIRSVFETRKKNTFILFLALYIPFLTFILVRTWQRNQIYNDTERYYTLLSQADTPYRFFGYQQLARMALEDNQPDKAYVDLHMALQQEFRSEFTHELLGTYYQQKNDPVKALHEFKLAYYYSLDSPRQLQFIGSTLIELGRYRHAARIFFLMRRLASDSIVPYTQLMVLHELLDQPDSVELWARSGLRVFESSPIKAASIRMALARFFYRSGRSEEALEQMREIIRRYPEAGGSADLARLCLGEMDPEQFLSLVENKYPHFQSAAPAFLIMADVLAGKRSQALEQLRRSRKGLLKFAKKNPLIRREIRLAEKFTRS